MRELNTKWTIAVLVFITLCVVVPFVIDFYENGVTSWSIFVIAPLASAFWFALRELRRLKHQKLARSIQLLVVALLVPAFLSPHSVNEVLVMVFVGIAIFGCGAAIWAHLRAVNNSDREELENT